VIGFIVLFLLSEKMSASIDITSLVMTKPPWILLASMQMFASLHIMMQCHLRVDCPFTAKESPSKDLWLLCEEVLAKSIQNFCDVPGDAFL
jgi:hypothetical protein